LFARFWFFFSCMILLLFTKFSSYVLFRFWVLGILGLLNFCWDMFTNDHLLQITFWFEMNGSHFDLRSLIPSLLTRSQVTGWNPLEGFTKSSCGNCDLVARSRLPTLKRGRGS
jgi:hypothetical protein